MGINDLSTLLPQGKYMTQQHQWFLLLGLRQTASHSYFLSFWLILSFSFTLTSFILPLHISLSHNHFVPTPIYHFLPFSVSPIRSLIHSASIYLWISESISIYVSLFGINLKSPSWSSNFIFIFLPLYLVIFSMHKIKLPHARQWEDSRGGSERGKGKTKRTDGRAERTRV